MKVTAETIIPIPTFRSIEVKIVLETVEEFNALYEVGNYCAAVQELINQRMEIADKANARSLPIHSVLRGIYVALKERKF